MTDTDVTSHSFLPTTICTPPSFPPLLPCLASQFRQGRVASVPPAPHPPIRGMQPLRVANPKIIPTNPLKSGRSSCCPASLHLVPGLPDPNLPSRSKMSISSPKCQCQPPRQTTNGNLFAKMHHPRAPHFFSISLPPCRPHSKLSNPWNSSSAVPPA